MRPLISVLFPNDMNSTSLNSQTHDRIADYFAVCGLSNTPTPYDVSEILINGEEIVLSESKCLDFSRYTTPIIDIQVITHMYHFYFQ